MLTRDLIQEKPSCHGYRLRKITPNLCMNPEPRANRGHFLSTCARCSIFPHHRRVSLRFISLTLVNSLQWVGNHQRDANFKTSWALIIIMCVLTLRVLFLQKCAHPKMIADCGGSPQGYISLSIF
ncbi:hypothetical protein BD769DRAFT_167102 [Suillus cothurnatus]|nr:hypothetical protein BD769DRAFT_167102 [Suillus cothurnatus]